MRNIIPTIGERIRLPNKRTPKRKRSRKKSEAAYRMFRIRSDIGEELRRRAKEIQQNPDDWLDDFLIEMMRSIILQPSTMEMLRHEAMLQKTTPNKIANDIIQTTLNRNRALRQNSA